MKIAFVLAIHLPTDERVFYQQAKTLIQKGHEIFIISMTKKVQSSENVFCFDYTNLSYSQKIQKIDNYLSIIVPDIIICDNPISIISSKRYKTKNKKKQLKIYYDITEYYPSRIHFHSGSKIKNILKFPFLISVSFYVSLLVSGFIFGEFYKKIPYKLFFWKKSVDLTYYANINQIKTFPINNNLQKVTLYYAGKTNQNSGYTAFMKVGDLCAKHFPNINFVLRIVSDDISEPQIINNENSTHEFLPLMSFPYFCNNLGEADIFFDLRQINYESTHSLPIKLFYYMAVGRPVIYSNLKAIRKGVPEFCEFGHLVNPDNITEIFEIVAKYIQNPSLYEKHCKQARKLAEKKYNWSAIEKNFIKFIDK